MFVSFYLVPIEKLIEIVINPLADEGVCQRVIRTFSTGTT